MATILSFAGFDHRKTKLRLAFFEVSAKSG
jgi:hypothetical protein